MSRLDLKKPVNTHYEFVCDQVWKLGTQGADTRLALKILWNLLRTQQHDRPAYQNELWMLENVEKLANDEKIVYAKDMRKMERKKKQLKTDVYIAIVTFCIWTVACILFEICPKELEKWYLVDLICNASWDVLRLTMSGPFVMLCAYILWTEREKDYKGKVPHRPIINREGGGSGGTGAGLQLKAAIRRLNDAIRILINESEAKRMEVKMMERQYELWIIILTFFFIIFFAFRCYISYTLIIETHSPFDKMNLACFALLLLWAVWNTVLSTDQFLFKAQLTSGRVFEWKKNEEKENGHVEANEQEVVNEETPFRFRFRL